MTHFIARVKPTTGMKFRSPTSTSMSATPTRRPGVIIPRGETGCRGWGGASLKTEDIPKGLTGLVLRSGNGTARMVEYVVSYLW